MSAVCIFMEQCFTSIGVVGSRVNNFEFITARNTCDVNRSQNFRVLSLPKISEIPKILEMPKISEIYFHEEGHTLSLGISASHPPPPMKSHASSPILVSRLND